MNVYQPKKICDDCLMFDHCSRSKKQKNACKKYEVGPHPPPPKSGSCVTPAFRKPVPMPEVKPAKQRTVLSVRDFAILYNMANEQIVRMESNAQRVYDYMFDDKFADSEMERQREIQIENNMKELQSNPCYQDLLRIRDKLGELNIEVETPSVEVE